MEDVNARRLKGTNKDLKIFRRLKGLRVVVDLLPLRKTYRDDRLRSDRMSDRRNQLPRKPGTIFHHRTAVTVLANVCLRPQELVQKVAVSSMELHAVSTRFDRELRGPRVRFL